MLRNARSLRRCTYGCCGDLIPNRTLRSREKRAWQKDSA